VRGYDYVAIGHVAVDRFEDGRQRPGGGAFYSGIQAARLGRRTLIVTRGERAVVERLLEPFAAELDVWIQESDQTTTLFTRGAGTARRQRVLAWAGRIDPVDVGDCPLVHLAPVAREVSAGTVVAECGFLGLTPQGLTRRWAQDGWMEAAKMPIADLPNRCSAVVISEAERAHCEEAVALVVERGGVAAITHGRRPAEIRFAETGFEMPTFPVAAVDDVGAGDVFAAALFCSLAAGEDLERAARFAQAAAALRVGGHGPGAIMPGDAISRRITKA
jgi:sugar/nucleoside kinase (ribokinase family)